MDYPVNRRPSINFEISVKTISGLFSLGYEIGAIINKDAERWRLPNGVEVSNYNIKELQQNFLQVKGKNRGDVIRVAETLKMTTIHIPHSFLYLYFRMLDGKEPAADKAQEKKKAK
eukprot:TRINITY_DN30162_c0_g2_i2.p1 TRINITY_DN30162_c0_g2~~TRINITY_DN30162_c0_g2_i2.p1  ORF type:complete len:116 (-),score=5.01 TRINITY_DN30162_c0_g2_i2:40-387(-)